MKTVDREQIALLMTREELRFAKEHPRARMLHDQAAHSLLSGIRMNWMTETQ